MPFAFAHNRGNKAERALLLSDSALPCCHTKEADMAEKKKRTTKKNTVMYKNKKCEVLEQNEHRTKLTDGTIHFWVRTSDVTGE